jgi:hypothetical protein
MLPKNRRITNTLGLTVFKFEMIAKDCEIDQRDFQSWGLTPTEGKRHIIFLTETPQKTNEYISKLTSEGVSFSYTDITQSVVMMIDVDPLLHRVYKYNEIFKWSIDQIRIQNLNIDDVLDKINEYGKDSLDDIDLRVLQNT